MDTYEKQIFERICGYYEDYKTLTVAFGKEIGNLKGYLDRKDHEITIVLNDEDAQIDKLIRQGKKADLRDKKEDNMPAKFADGSFRKRGNLLEYRFMSNGKQIPVYGKTKNDCYAEREKYLKGEVKQAKAATFGAWIKEWFDLYKKGKFVERYEKHILSAIENKIIPALGKIPLKKLDTTQIQNFLNGLGATPNAQRKTSLVIKECLKDAFNSRKIPFNPCGAVRIKTVKPQNYPALQIGEQCRALDAIDNPEYKRMFVFMCCTGFRISEALSLCAEDFDAKNGVIYLKTPDTKTKKHKRKVPYLPELIDLPAKGRIFACIKQTTFRTYFSDLFGKLGIKAVPHSFRHTFASNCYHAGIKDKQIQEWLGHSTIAMTLDVYTTLLGGGTSPLLEYIKRLKNHLGV
jgi:integrase